MVFEAEKEIESIGKKAGRLAQKIGELTNEYKPAHKSSFMHITNEITSRISLLEHYIMSNGNGKEQKIDRAKDELAILGKYIAAIKKDKTFREYELSEPYGILAKNNINIMEKEVRRLRINPEEYIVNALEYATIKK
jgi:hypothetical protein